MDRLRVRFSASSANTPPELVRVSHPRPRWALNCAAACALFLSIIGQPGCLASSAGESQDERLHRLRETLQEVTHGTDGAAIQHLRNDLRRTLRPPFALSLLAVGGIFAVAIIAVRCRIREQERLRSLRRLRQFSLFESTFPERLSAELRGLLARLHGRSELLVERKRQSSGMAMVGPGLNSDARRLQELLEATRRIADLGPALRIGSRSSVDLGSLIVRAGGTPGGSSATRIVTNEKFLQLGLEILLGAAAGPTEEASTDTGNSAPLAVFVHPPENDEVLLTITSPHDLSRPGRSSGVALGHRILLCLGGRMRIATEHQTGSQLEMELPLL